MNSLFTSVIAVGLLFSSVPQSNVGGPATSVTTVAGKNCRVVDMCWFKNGKRHCFKKRVCD
jgi:hypothetical protein